MYIEHHWKKGSLTEHAFMSCHHWSLCLWIFETFLGPTMSMISFTHTWNLSMWNNKVCMNSDPHSCHQYWMLFDDVTRLASKSAPEKFAMISCIRRVDLYVIQSVQSYDNNATEAMTRCLKKVTWTDPTNHLLAPPPPPQKKKKINK